MYLSTSTHSQLGSSFQSSPAEPIESDSETNLKAFIVQSSPILCQYSSHTFGCKLHLKHYLGEEMLYLIK